MFCYVLQAMAIYKQVMPEHNNNKQIKQVTSNQSNASPQMDTDEAYEYFSDKEEAEKHRKTEKQKPRIL